MRGRWMQAAVLAACGLTLVVPAGTQARTLRHAATTPSPAPKACSVLRAGDVKAALGKTATAAKGGTQGAFSTCTYRVGSQTIFFLIADQDAIKAKTAYSNTAAYWKVMTAGSYAGKFQAVHGLGVPALWLSTFKQLWLLKGTTMLSFSALPLSTASLPMLTKLAKQALKRV